MHMRNTVNGIVLATALTYEQSIDYSLPVNTCSLGGLFLTVPSKLQRK